MMCVSAIHTTTGILIRRSVGDMGRGSTGMSAHPYIDHVP